MIPLPAFIDTLRTHDNTHIPGVLQDPVAENTECCDSTVSKEKSRAKIESSGRV